MWSCWWLTISSFPHVHGAHNLTTDNHNLGHKANIFADPEWRTGRKLPGLGS